MATFPCYFRNEQAPRTSRTTKAPGSQRALLQAPERVRCWAVHWDVGGHRHFGDTRPGSLYRRRSDHGGPGGDGHGRCSTRNNERADWHGNSRAPSQNIMRSGRKRAGSFSRCIRTTRTGRSVQRGSWSGQGAGYLVNRRSRLHQKRQTSASHNYGRRGGNIACLSLHQPEPPWEVK